MNSTLQAKDIMTTNPLTLHKEMSIALAIDLLMKHCILGAPVVDDSNKLIGFLSVHDVMVDLWCESYTPNNNQTVDSLMSQKITSIAVNASFETIIEHLSIDKDQLYPTSSMGIGIANKLVSIPLEERAKKMNITKPQTLPVLDNGTLVGVISRMEVLKALRSMYATPINNADNAEELKIA